MLTEDVLFEASRALQMFFLHGAEGQNLTTFNKVNFLCLNFKPERPG